MGYLTEGYFINIGRPVPLAGTAPAIDVLP